MITHDELLELIEYNRETGEFYWKVKRKGVRKGSLAGTIHRDGYNVVTINYKHYGGHRLAWFYIYGTWPKNEIDHINCNRSDNRIENLREATGTQNQWNAKLSKANSSGFKGVSWCRSNKAFRSTIKTNGVQRTLGYFKTAEAAYQAYCLAAEELHGEFARCCCGGEG